MKPNIPVSRSLMPSLACGSYTHKNTCSHTHTFITTTSYPEENTVFMCWFCQAPEQCSHSVLKVENGTLALAITIYSCHINAKKKQTNIFLSITKNVSSQGSKVPDHKNHWTQLLTWCMYIWFQNFG